MHYQCHTVHINQQAEEQRLASMHVDQHMQPALLRQVSATLHTVTRYEDPLLQAMALSLMPMDTIQARARDTIDMQRRLGDAGTLQEEDVIAEELTAWFKRDFFTWYALLVSCAHRMHGVRAISVSA